MRYILFGGTECFYASGGANDFLGAGDSIDDLTNSEVLKKKSGLYGEIIEWWHIFDTEKKEIVLGTHQQAFGGATLPKDKSI